MTITVLMCIGGAFFTGFTSGVLVRQPEINRLRKQVKQLQKTNSKLNKMIEEQYRQVEKLRYQNKTLYFYQLIEKHKNKAMYRGELLKLYAIKEYLDLLYIQLVSEKDMDENEIKFFEAFDVFIENQRKISDKDMEYVKKYIISKYWLKLLFCKRYNVENNIERIKNIA